MLDAVERGLSRALQATPTRSETLVDDLATLREARGQWAEAAVALSGQPEETTEVMTLARAARDYLQAGDVRAAERLLLAALRRQPGQGALYRRLAVDVYAARGDFPTAERVLRDGEQHAFDRLPVYQAMTEVLARRDTALAAEVAGPHPPPREDGDDVDVEDDGPDR
jgi:predicted Zn-dependent protease